MSLTVTDLFAGAGGSSTGMIAIPGVEVRIAANHWRTAVEIHNANHPDTDHSTADLHEENPAYFPRTDILWASPECTKWSQANGTKLPAIEEGLFEDPLSDDAKTRSRLLMFDVLRFIAHHRYRLVFIENVVDIATQAKYRLAWAVWRQELRALGYQFRVISMNSMHAQTFGSPVPQSRDRIYIAAWPENEKAPDFDRILKPRAFCSKCDQVIDATQAWKNGKTVGRYRQSYVYIHGACGTVVEPGYLPAAAAIDWTISGERIGDRLSEKTRPRIAAGIARYWGPFHLEAAGNQYDAADLKHPQHGDPNAYFRAWSIAEYLRTLHTVESKALAVPVEGRDGKQAAPMGQPLRTQTTRAETAMVTPFIAELRGGGSDAYGTAARAKPVGEPIGTLTTVDRYALIHRNNSGGASMTTKKRSVTAADLRAAEEMVPECLFRMLRPHEVAAGMAFPDDYNWQPPDRNKPVSNRDLVKAAGNAVTPPAARDLMGIAVEQLAGDA